MLHDQPQVSHYEHCISENEIANPKTQLFVDVNGTITSFDSTHGHNGMSDEDIMAALVKDIAGQIYGTWKPELPQMSYKSYIEQYLLPADPNLDKPQRQILYKKRDVELAKIFECLDKERSEYWLKKVISAKDKIKELKGIVFPSFIELIKHSNDENSCQVVLRTFSDDGPLVMQEVNDCLGYNFFNLNVYKLSYADSDYFSLKNEQGSEEIVHRRDLGERICQLGNCVIQDDFDTWYKNNYSNLFGKPFPVNPAYKCVFFDDNAWTKPIIAPFDSKTGNLVKSTENYLPRISTLEMILNDKSMIDIVSQSHLEIFDSCQIPTVEMDNLSALPTTDLAKRRIYLIRHGDCAQLSQPEIGKEPPPFELTEKGKKQSLEWGLNLISKLKPDDKIVILSSTTFRSQQTANIALNEMQKKCSQIIRGKDYQGLCELLRGKWEGKHKDAEFFATVENWNKLPAKEKFAALKYVTGESYQDVAQRAIADLQTISDQYPDHTIFVVTQISTISAIADQFFDRDSGLLETPGSSIDIPDETLKSCEMLLIETPVGASIEKEGRIRMHINPFSS